MKLTLAYYLVAFILLSLSWSCNSEPKTQQETTYLGVPIASIEQEMDALIHLFFPTAMDSNGGYWTNFEYDWTRSEAQPKMLVTQARGLWTAARASLVYPDNDTLKQAAHHGYQFLTEKMWDTENGGFYLYASDKTATTPKHKMIYAHAFAVYALAAYSKINPDPAVKDWLQKAFMWMEEVSHDTLYLGYYNLVLPNNLSQEDIQKIGWGNPNWKDQNTSIHILEAFTTLYEVMPTPLVKQRLEEMLHLVRDSMVNEAGYLHLYFTSNWQPISHQDSSRTYILAHLKYDHRSFGHDIEMAYLLLEASKILYGEYDTQTLAVAKRLIDQTLAYGFDKNYFGLHDRGYQFAGSDSLEIVGLQKVWWAQAEAWHSLALAAELYPNEPLYQQAFQQMWHYIQTHIIDHEHGGWYASGLDINPDSKTAKKAQEWKGIYHDGRALMQVWEYAQRER